jgi:hypothetical protein
MISPEKRLLHEKPHALLSLGLLFGLVVQMVKERVIRGFLRACSAMRRVPKHGEGYCPLENSERGHCRQTLPTLQEW